MFDRSLDAVFAALLLVLLLPSLAWYFIRSGLDSRFSQFNHSKSLRIARPQMHVGEFDFEHAIQAYEELIDATFAEGQL